MQLLEAVECLHANSILHCFVNPQAISFHGSTLKLFVPSRSVVLQHPDESLDVGETWYRCPENLKNNLINKKYDIWSVGWTLYNLCSLDDSRFVLDEVEDFQKWFWPDLPRHYTRNLDKIFKM
jgi:serine/threonine protein kinase